MRKLLISLILLAPTLAPAATIINPLPNNIQNGQPADATKVMGNFNQIVNNVNSNAAALTSSNVFTGAQSFSPATTTAQGATAGQVIGDAFAWLGTAGGTANALTATANVAPAAYAAGQRWKVKASATNTGATTINISGLGVRAVTRYGSTALLAGDIVINTVIELADDGTELQLLNPANVPNAATANSATSAATAVSQSGGTVNAVGGISNGGKLLISDAAPAILSCGAGAVISSSNGTAAFLVTVGSSGITSCQISLPAAPVRWVCTAAQQVSAITPPANQILRVTDGGNSVTIGSYDITTNANLAFTASQSVNVVCAAN